MKKPFLTIDLTEKWGYGPHYRKVFDYLNTIESSNRINKIKDDILDLMEGFPKGWNWDIPNDEEDSKGFYKKIDENFYLNIVDNVNNSNTKRQFLNNWNIMIEYLRNNNVVVKIN